MNWGRLTTTKAALVLVVFGLVAVAVYFFWAGTADWAPNIATEAFSIAVTILVVDQIVQREVGDASNRDSIEPSTFFMTPSASSRGEPNGTTSPRT
jgi:hypothetical protein